MQATAPPPTNNPFNRNLGYFLAAPITTLVLGVVILAFVITGYQSRHNGRIYTGVTVAGIDLSALETAEAEAALANAFADANSQQITFSDPATGQSWTKTPAELGMRVDPEATTAAAYSIGRDGNSFTQLQEMVQSWYYGRSIPPVLVLDEGQLQTVFNELAGHVNRMPVNAQVSVDGETIEYIPGEYGRALDTADLRQRLMQPMNGLQPANIELLVHDVVPTISDSAEVSAEIQYTISSPVTFYLAAPLDEFDLSPITLSAAQLSAWLRVEVVETAAGQLSHHSFIDEVALRQWLAPFAQQLY
ncbi:MAG: peptidoglycan binding domain-containing protein, partial [Anaerolineae bacterium]